MTAKKLVTAVCCTLFPVVLKAASATILGWNNLGMHCMDSDYSVFTVLPPYNTIEAQLVVNGQLVTNGTGYSVTYEAVADADGSFNSTSVGKSTYSIYGNMLYGADTNRPDKGLLEWSMPGISNIPQNMTFEATNRPAPIAAAPVNWWRAEGIPITPYDDAGNKNPYPLMRMIARNGSNLAIATNDVVLPVSDEMDCRVCHASGTQAAAQPAAGWVWDGLPERDYRLNILRLHDEREFASHGTLYQAALAAKGFNAQGLYRNVTADGKPVLCALCHASEALGLPSFQTIPALTASIHSLHAQVMDPELNMTLNNSAHRAACYRCHPGSTTKCLRGAMGAAVAADGSMQMQCQSCHGTMSQVGASTRIGWFQEPLCQSCHSGTATSNNGQIRYTSVFTNATGGIRLAVDRTFAVQTNMPITDGLDLALYRFSSGHGGLQCSACHGSTHAEFPSTHANDNRRNLQLQGHAGMMTECTACHVTMSVSTNTAVGGPHGLHPISQSWVSSHGDIVETLGDSGCRKCHGTDLTGTVLSRAQADRTFNINFDTYSATVSFFRGAVVGCSACHVSAGSTSPNTAPAPVVTSFSTNTLNSAPLGVALAVSGASVSGLRIISQPANGSVGLDTNTGVATYYPAAGFVGVDTFTFAAYNGQKNSNLGTGTVAVAQGPFSIGVVGHVPPRYPAEWPVAFGAVAAVTNHNGPVTFEWDFGDGSPHSTNQYAAHAYAQARSYNWSVTATIAGVSASASGALEITAPMTLAAAPSASFVNLSWPLSLADSLLETTPVLGPGANWTWVTNSPTAGSGALSLTVPAEGNAFFRLKRVW